MKRGLFLLFIFVFAFFIDAKSALHSITNGNWSTKGTWSNNYNGSSCNCTPSKTDEVFVYHTVALTTDSEIKSLHIKPSGSLHGNFNLEFWNNGYLIVEGIMSIGSIDIKNVGVDFTIESSGELSLSGDFDAGNLPITCNGNIVVGGTITSGSISGEGTISANDYNVDGTVFDEAAPADGTTYAGLRWTGTGDVAWENSANWSSGSVPGITTSVRISAGVNQPIISGQAVCKTLIIEPSAGIFIDAGGSLHVDGKIINNAGVSGITIRSDNTATGSIINATDSVAATVERYISGSSGNPYHYVSSPVNSAGFGSIWKTGDYNVYYYDESNTDPGLDQGWIKKSSGTLTNGKGYAVVGNSNKKFIYSGLLNAINMNVSVSYTSTSGPYPNGDPQGWNLIGNPYPTAISAAAFITENTSKLDNASTQAVYFWNNPNGDLNRSDYATRTTTTGIHGATDTIALGQGFFVKVVSGVTSLSFSNAQKMVSYGTPFFTPSIYSENLKISVSGPEGLFNETAFSFLIDASRQHDALFDAVKLKGNPNIAFYSFMDDNPNIYAIQGRPPVSENDNIKLGLYAGKAGDYIIKISDMENISPDMNISLVDYKTNKMYDLRKENLKVNLAKGEYNNRFILKLTPQSVSADISIDPVPQIDAYSNENRIFIHQNKGFNGVVKIYDPLGRLIEQSDIKAGENKIIYLPEYSGIAYITFIGNDFSSTKKLFLGSKK